MDEPIYIKEPHQVVVEDDEINLSEYLHVLSKYKWSISLLDLPWAWVLLSQP